MKNTTDTWLSGEPSLTFGGGNSHVDPMAGLAIFGPLYPDTHKTITVGLIGSRESIYLTSKFLDSLNGVILFEDDDPILFPKYPGMNAAFRSSIKVEKSLIHTISEYEIQNITRLPTSSERVIRASDAFLQPLDSMRSSEPLPDVVICAIPKDVEDYCWSSRESIKSKYQKVADAARRREAKKGQLFLDVFDEELVPVIEARGSIDLHSRIKAGAMIKNVKTQIILETSLNGERTTEPKSTFAWNFALAIFYKSNGYPWRLTSIAQNDCFVGISFYKERGSLGETMGVSIAQIFDKSGEGLILKGGKVKLTDGEEKSPHLSYEDSKKLVQSILQIYEQRNERPPARVVFHKTSKFWNQEIDGLKDGLGKSIKADYVAIERSDLRFVRNGEYPPLRGTCIGLSNQEYLVYGMGYVPYLGTYPGHHVPTPLHIMQHIGEATPQKICSEIMGLTKMNWNTAHFCTGIPITLNMSRKVSSIIREIPEGAEINPSYRFYM